jgi:hypothetical protein
MIVLQDRVWQVHWHPLKSVWQNVNMYVLIALDVHQVHGGVQYKGKAVENQ